MSRRSFHNELGGNHYRSGNNGVTLVFTGTRVPIQTLFDYIEGGDDLNHLLEDYLTVSNEAAILVLGMAKKSITSEKSLMKILPDENLPKQLKADLDLNMMSKLSAKWDGQAKEWRTSRTYCSQWL